jgi:hypothetical protein
MEKDPNSQTAEVVARFYNELKEKNFTFDSRKQYEQYQVDVPEGLAPAVSYKMGREFNILPLPDKIHKTYLIYKENGDIQALRDLQPSDIIRLYMYAVVKGDADTAYDLLYKGERTPAKEEFEMEIKNKSAEFQDISNRVYKVYEEYNEKGDTATFELIFKDGSSISHKVKIDLGDYTSSVVYQ